MGTDIKASIPVAWYNQCVQSLFVVIRSQLALGRHTNVCAYKATCSCSLCIHLCCKAKLSEWSIINPFIRWLSKLPLFGSSHCHIFTYMIYCLFTCSHHVHSWNNSHWAFNNNQNTSECLNIGECPSNSPFLKNNGAEAPKGPKPIVFKEWKDTRTFPNLKSTHCTLLILLIINRVAKKGLCIVSKVQREQ
jgi:hypothetical protein